MLGTRLERERFVFSYFPSSSPLFCAHLERIRTSFFSMHAIPVRNSEGEGEYRVRAVGGCPIIGRTSVLSRVKRRSTSAYHRSFGIRTREDAFECHSITPRHRPRTILGWPNGPILLYRRAELTRACYNRPNNGANMVYTSIHGPCFFHARTTGRRDGVSGRVPFSNATGSRHAAGDSPRPRERTERRS